MPASRTLRSQSRRLTENKKKKNETYETKVQKTKTMSSDLASIFAQNKTNDVVAQKWCCTKTDTVKIDYVWTIDKFKLSETAHNYVLQSAIFSTPKDENTKWQLVLYSKSHIEDKEYLSLYLRLCSSKRPKISAEYQLSIFNSKLKKAIKFQSLPRIFELERLKNIYGCSAFLDRKRLTDEAKDFLPNGKLTVFCEISVVAETVVTSGQTNTMNETPECRLEDNLGIVLENEIFSDVTLVVNEREFKCHKVILSAQSIVFEAMFTHDMRERRTNRVEKIDMDHRVVEAMLRFIYTGKTTNLEGMAVQLLAAADKYALGRLKFMCERALFQTLTIENVANLLTIADLHDAKQLKANAIDFMNMHKDSVRRTASYKSICNSYPRLIVEAFNASTINDPGADSESEEDSSHSSN